MGEFKQIGRDLSEISTRINHLANTVEQTDTNLGNAGGSNRVHKLAKNLLHAATGKTVQKAIVGGAKGVAFHGAKGVLNTLKYGALVASVVGIDSLENVARSDQEYSKARGKTARALSHAQHAVKLSQKTFDLMNAVQESDDPAKLQKLQTLVNIQQTLVLKTRKLVAESQGVKTTLSNLSLSKVRANDFHHQSVKAAEQVNHLAAASRVLYENAQNNVVVGDDYSVNSDDLAINEIQQVLSDRNQSAARRKKIAKSYDFPISRY